MAFTKLTNADFNDKGALAMPNRPSETMSAQEIKTQFDAPSREVVMPAYNRLIDELEDPSGAASIGVVAPTGGSGQTVQALFNNAYNKIDSIDEDVQEIIDDVTEIAEQSEAWAVGTRGGVPVEPTDPTYHNNSKWYSENLQVDLDNINDVDITDPTNGDALVYDSTSEKWVNGAADVGLFVQDGILMCRYEV